MFQELINCCCSLLKERAKSHVFVLFMFLIETSDFVVVDEKMLREGYQNTFQYGWQYGSLFVCFYLLPAETQCTFFMELRQPCLLLLQTLFLKDYILTMPSFTLLCVLERSIKTSVFCGRNVSANIEDCSKKLQTLPHTDFPCVRNKHNRNTHRQAVLSQAPWSQPQTPVLICCHTSLTLQQSPFSWLVFKNCSTNSSWLQCQWLYWN